MTVSQTTIPRYPMIVAVTAPASGSPATIASLINSAMTSGRADYAANGSARVQVDIQSQGSNGLLVWSDQGTTGAGSWKIAAGDWKDFPGSNIELMKIASQSAGSTEAAVIAIYIAP